MKFNKYSKYLMLVLIFAINNFICYGINLHLMRQYSDYPISNYFFLMVVSNSISLLTAFLYQRWNINDYNSILKEMEDYDLQNDEIINRYKIMIDTYKTQIDERTELIKDYQQQVKQSLELVDQMKLHFGVRISKGNVQ